MQAFRRKARQLGAEYHVAEVTGFESSVSNIEAVVCSDGSRIEGAAFVNCAGPWAADLAEKLDLHLPVSPRKRQAFMIDCEERIEDMPLVFDSSGAWFRPEGNGYIAGKAPPPENDPEGGSLDRIDYQVFEDEIWPILATRVPAFEALRVRSAWAGYYAVNTLDHNAILGRHPETDNFYLANGFSGHGMMHAPAVGRGLAELIATGSYQSLDLGAFGYDRILRNEPILEATVY